MVARDFTKTLADSNGAGNVIVHRKKFYVGNSKMEPSVDMSYNKGR